MIISLGELSKKLQIIFSLEKGEFDINSIVLISKSVDSLMGYYILSLIFSNFGKKLDIEFIDSNSEIINFIEDKEDNYSVSPIIFLLNCGRYLNHYQNLKTKLNIIIIDSLFNKINNLENNPFYFLNIEENKDYIPISQQIFLLFNFFEIDTILHYFYLFIGLIDSFINNFINY